MRKMCFKLTFLALVGMVINNLSALTPAIDNQLAMLQLENTNASLVTNNMMGSFNTVLWGIFILLTVMLLKSDIQKLFKKEGKKDE